MEQNLCARILRIKIMCCYHNDTQKLSKTKMENKNLNKTEKS